MATEIVDSMSCPAAIEQCQLDGKGGKQDNPSSTPSVTNPFWFHLNEYCEASADWIDNTHRIPSAIKKKLKQHDKYSKVVRVDDSILITLRNVKPEFDDFLDAEITLTTYISADLIMSISNSETPLEIIRDLNDDINEGIGPVDVTDWLIFVSDSISDYAARIIETLYTQLMDLEDLEPGHTDVDYAEMGKLRQRLIILRHYIMLQCETFTRLSTERVTWIDTKDRQHIYDISHRLNQYINDIDNCIGRVKTIVDHCTAMNAELLNRRMYIMMLFTMIFLPLSFFTGLFGVNLGGIPGAESQWGFYIFIIMLASITFFVGRILKKRKWL